MCHNHLRRNHQQRQHRNRGAWPCVLNQVIVSGNTTVAGNIVAEEGSEANLGNGATQRARTRQNPTDQSCWTRWVRARSRSMIRDVGREYRKPDEFPTQVQGTVTSAVQPLVLIQEQLPRPQSLLSHLVAGHHQDIHRGLDIQVHRHQAQHHRHLAMRLVRHPIFCVLWIRRNLRAPGGACSPLPGLHTA